MQMLFIPVALVVMFVIFRTIKKGQISLNDSFFWMTASVVMLILGIFPKVIDKVAEFFGIAYPPSLLFLLSIIFLLYICFRMLKQINILNLRVIELGQQLAILKEKNQNSKKVRSNK